MLPALILAGGASSRMGAPKALLRAPDGRLFVTRIALELATAGAGEVVIVTGTHHEAISAAVGGQMWPVPLRVIRNEDPARGQISSLWVGMDATVTEATEGLVVTLVDVPLVNASTIRHLIDVWQATRAPIVRPAIGDRHGHPVIFDRRVFAELRAAPMEAGAKAVVRAHADELVNVMVEDAGCLVDVDTPEDFAALGHDADPDRGASRRPA